MTVARPHRTGLPRWAVVTPARRAHIERVAGLAGRWADAMRVPPVERDRWLRAVWYHDALRDLPGKELERLAGDAPGPAELWHGPAAADAAEREGERDRGVLDAVRYHSLGYHGWDLVGRALYAADFLEPGRPFDQEARAALADRFPDDPDGVLREVARRRMAWLVRSGWQIPEPTWRFWNSVAAGWSL